MQEQEWTKVAAVAGSAGAIGLLVGIATGIIGKRYGGWRAWLQGLVSAVLVAALVGLGIHDTALGPATQAALIGGCAFVASDILEATVLLAGLVKSDPIGVFQRIRKALSGGGQ